MLVEVELRAFDHRADEIKNKYNVGYANEGIRYVDLPDENVVREEMFLNSEDAKSYMLEWVWHYGQNDFQPKQQRSLMVGDVVRLYDRRYKVDDIGFEEIN